MVDACKAVGLPEPEYGTDAGFVWITFMRPNSVTNSDTNTNTNGAQQLSDKHKEILAFCIVPRSSREILEHIGVTYHNKNIEKFINQLIGLKLLRRTIPNNPYSPYQKYVIKQLSSNENTD